jgi:hypothetical protein
MTVPGLGGQQDAPQNAPGALAPAVGVQPGVSRSVVIANAVIVFGPSGAVVGVFVYAAGTTPGLGNPPIFWATNQTADPYGNAVTPTAGVAGTGQFTAGPTTINSSGIFAGFTVINASGIFSYSGTPATGNLIFSSAAAAGTDPHSNPYVEGAAAYVTISGVTYAIQLGESSFGGILNAGLFIHTIAGAGAAFADPSLIGAGTSAGSSAILSSGQANSGSAVCGIQATDSTGSGIAGGEVAIVAGQTVLVSGGAAIPWHDNLQTIGSAPGAYSQSYTDAMATRLNAVINTLLNTKVGAFP